jgi:hypothetical protein
MCIGDVRMRSTVELPDKLLEDAKRLSSIRTTKGIIEAALEEFVRARRLERLIARVGRGDFLLTHEELERMREDN